MERSVKLKNKEEIINNKKCAVHSTALFISFRIGNTIFILYPLLFFIKTQNRLIILYPLQLKCLKTDFHLLQW